MVNKHFLTEIRKHSPIQRSLGRLLWRCFLLVILLGQPVLARDIIWQFTGFGTLGYTETDKHEQRQFRRNITQSLSDLRDNGLLVDSRIGFKVDALISDQLEFVGQAVLQSQATERPIDYLDSAFFRYIHNDKFQLRVGRIPFDVFFLSDHRSVSYSYDWVRPPTEMYGLIVFKAIDGARFITSWGDFDSAWEWSVTYGESTINLDNATDANETSGSFDSVKADPLISTSLSWRNLDWHVHFSAARVDFKSTQSMFNDEIAFLNSIESVWPEPAQLADDIFGNDYMYYSSLGVLRNYKNWKFQMELGTIKTDLAIFQGQQAYFHLSRRIGDVTPYATFRLARDSRKNIITPPPAGLGLDSIYTELNTLTERFKFNQKSIAIGVRYDFAPQKAVKFQCDTFAFEAGSAGLLNRRDETYQNDETRSWCSLNFDWIF